MLEDIKNHLIVSCQALEYEPLHSSFIMSKMALAVYQGGAKGIRANTIEDIQAIKKEVDLPIIGIIKQEYEGSVVFITPTIKEVDALVKEGVDIIDVGGESTRPGYTLLSDDEEISRIVPVIENLKKEFDVPISLDTYKGNVAKEGIKAGADLINDIWGLKYDDILAKVIAENNVTCCLMHNRKDTNYKDFLTDVVKDLQETIDIAQNAGIKEDKIILDPGIGFAKTYEQNLIMLKNLSSLHKLNFPLFL